MTFRLKSERALTVLWRSGKILQQYTSQGSRKVMQITLKTYHAKFPQVLGRPINGVYRSARDLSPRPPQYALLRAPRCTHLYAHRTSIALGIHRENLWRLLFSNLIVADSITVLHRAHEAMKRETDQGKILMDSYRLIILVSSYQWCTCLEVYYYRCLFSVYLFSLP